MRPCTYIYCVYLDAALHLSCVAKARTETDTPIVYKCMCVCVGVRECVCTKAYMGWL